MRCESIDIHSFHSTLIVGYHFAINASIDSCIFSLANLIITITTNNEIITLIYVFIDFQKKTI